LALPSPRSLNDCTDDGDSVEDKTALAKTSLAQTEQTCSQLGAGSVVAINSQIKNDYYFYSQNKFVCLT